MSDVTFIPAKSTADLPITSPIHKPCPDMAGMENPDPKKRERARFLVSKLREKHGIKKRVKCNSQPMNYVCSEKGCVDPWGSVSNANPGDVKQ